MFHCLCYLPLGGNYRFIEVLAQCIDVYNVCTHFKFSYLPKRKTSA